MKGVVHLILYILKKVSKALAPIYRSLYFPPAVIFIVIFSATLLSWGAAKQSLHHDIVSAASARADNAEQALREHMLVYDQILRGGVGLFRSSDVVTRDEWESFLETFNIDGEPSGVKSIGFIKVINSGDLADVQDFADSQGLKNFQITPSQPRRDQYAAVLYVHPIKPSNVALQYGFDVNTDPLRRAAMTRARDTGLVSMTPRIELLPKTADSPNYGFSMYAPYYLRTMPAGTTAERRAAVRGYVYGTLQASDFFKHVIGSADTQNSGYHVDARNNGSAGTLYESPMFADVSKRPYATFTTRTLTLYGQTWTIKFVADYRSLVSGEQLSRPDSLLFFGILSAFLVASVVMLLIKARARDLRSQKDKAVELAKDELLSLASHQLRTPATGVKQYVGMVLQGFAGKVPATQRKLLEKAYASNDRQLRIINEILHLAKIDSGRIVLAKQVTDLNELVSDVINEQMPDVESAKHMLSVNLPKDHAMVYADTHMLRMAIENLLSNAIKYTPSGGRIDIEVKKKTKKAQICFRDTGIGIKPSDMDKVFRQFSRLPNAMSQQVGGTGIGLYLAKHLVELHKGTISVRSSLGKGSTFTITLPAHEGTDERMRNLTVKAKA